MSTALIKRQHWLYDAIVSDRAPAKPERHLGGTTVDPHIGLGVYRHAYRARLLEALTDDFTAVAKVLGDDAFARLCADFIGDQPPQDATLNAYGRLFAPWLERSRVPRRAALIELARLEWALVEAIHAALGPALSGADLAGVAPHAWGRIRLRPAPSLRVLPCRFATNALYEAFRAERPLNLAVRRAGGVAVIRQRQGLQRFDLDPHETRVLRALSDGATLGDALQGVTASRLPAIRDAFSRWVAQGFFTALD